MAISVLALPLERVAEVACGDTWHDIRHDLERVKLARLSAPEGTVRQIAEPTPEATTRPPALEIARPSLLLDHP